MPHRRPRIIVGLLAGSLGLALAPVSSGPADAVPTLSAVTIVSGLSHPWDLTWVGSLMLYNTRNGQVWSKSGSANPQRVDLPGLEASTFAQGEGGLLGMVADPVAATNRRFYTCGATKNGSGAAVDVRVRRWSMTSDVAAVSEGNVIVGLPLTSGRHSGCRLRFGDDGKLYVGTGDAAQGTNPQDLDSLGGKVLRVNSDGTVPTDNPFASRTDNARFVWTYGHRNIQGLALRPGTKELWSAEHGSSRDDEINLIARSANYGWNPVPGYDETGPMTDHSLPGTQTDAAWSSGSPTVATSGLTFLEGPAWGRWQGAMAVGLLKDQGISIVTLNPAGVVSRVEALAAAERTNYRRIRTVQQGPDGALYFTTSNGTDDKIVRLQPTAANPLPAYTPGLDVSPVGVAAARTGNTFYLYGRSPAGNVHYRLSNNDAVSWAGWTQAGVTSTSAPAVASSAAGRIDLITRSASGSAVHTWFVNGVRAGQTDLGGSITAAPAVVSEGNGILDVFVRGSSPYGAARNRYANGSWSGWQQLGGVFTSALGASIDRSTGIITVTGRGANGSAFNRTVTATSNGDAWRSTGITLWSARALADTDSKVGLVGVSSGSDSNAVVDRGPLVMGVSALYNSAPAVVSRDDGTWVMFGRSSNNSAYLYDAGPGGYRNVFLGGGLG